MLFREQILAKIRNQDEKDLFEEISNGYIEQGSEGIFKRLDAKLKHVENEFSSLHAELTLRIKGGSEHGI